MKVCVLFERLGPYHHARLGALAQLTRVSAIELLGIDRTYDWDRVERSSVFEQATLFPDASAQSASSNGSMRRKLEAALRRMSPSVVAIPGWSSPYALHALAYCLSTGVPAILMSASTKADFHRSSLREYVKRRLVHLYSAAIVGGTRQASYLHSLNFGPKAIFRGYNSVDNAHFRRARVRGDGVDYVKQIADVRHDFFLSVGRLVPKKNFDGLLRAYAEYRRLAEGRPWDLVIVGDGPERPELMSLIAELKIAPSVHMAGFIQYGLLPALYASASGFILASKSEQWGLVVNEAMAAGLPILVSSKCGCVDDLVKSGDNGWTFDPARTYCLATGMNKISRDPKNARKFGAKSTTIVKAFDVSRFASGMVAAADFASDVHPGGYNMLDRALLSVMVRL